MDYEDFRRQMQDSQPPPVQREPTIVIVIDCLVFIGGLLLMLGIWVASK